MLLSSSLLAESDNKRESLFPACVPPSFLKEEIFSKPLELHFSIEIRKIQKIFEFCSAVRQEKEMCFKADSWYSG